MGYYINETSNGDPLVSRGKAEQLVQNGDAKFLNEPPKSLPGDRAIICVIDNVVWDAAGLCYSQYELDTFRSPDGRSKKWLSMDKSLAHKLADYNQ